MANYATLRDGEVTEGSIMTHTQLAAWTSQDRGYNCIGGRFWNQQMFSEISQNVVQVDLRNWHVVLWLHLYRCAIGDGLRIGC